LPCEAQTAAQNREEIRNLNQKLSAVEKALADLQTALAAAQKFDQRVSVLEQAAAASQGKPSITEEQRNYLNRVEALKEKLDPLQEKMVLTAGSLAATQMNISYNYFTIFGLIFTLLLTLMGLVGTLGAAYIKGQLLGSLTRDVEKQIGKSIEEEEKEMKRIARFETDLAMADTLFKMSFAWWAQYEEPFRKLLPKRKTRTDHEPFNALPEAALLQLTMARILSERGMKISNAPTFSDTSKDDGRPWVIRARLLNLWVYNTTADFCRKQIASEDEKEKTELLRSADLLIDLAKDKRAAKGGFWYNFQQTAAFAMMNVGDPATQQLGQALIDNLYTKKTPGEEFEPPSDEWIADMQAENRLGVAETGALGNPAPA
jgi:hypothetical protein